MQRRQMQQMNDLYRRSQEQARLAQQQQDAYRERQAELARQQQGYQSDAEQLRRRAMQLDTNNRDLHAQLAKSEQEIRLLKDQVNLLNQRLGESANQLATVQRAREASAKKVDALEASLRRRGGATITANSSVATRLKAISIPGIQVRQDGDVIRMELPSDQLFTPRSAELNPAALSLIDQVADAIVEHYPRQIIGIEGHTDNVSITGTAWRSNHQLSAAQAMAVLDQMAKNNAISAQQLSQAGHGPNYPVASNATAAGKARNRRIEIVIYPETLDAR
jgi:chemotaxis protein MotB